MAVTPSSSVALYRAGDPYEQLISNMLTIERQPQGVVESERAEQVRLKGVMSDVNTRLSALHKVLTRFTDIFSTGFKARKANVAGSVTGFSVSASDTAALGTNALKVERLAASDNRLSKVFGTAGSTLASFVGKEQTFSIEVLSPTAENAENRVAIEVKVTPAGANDRAILDEVSSAIKSAMDAAVTAGTIKSQDVANAAVINETSSTSRLTLRSSRTGFAGRLGFTDSADGLLAALDVTNAALVSGTAGGQVTQVGTSETDSDLNSRFVLNGMTLYRNSNEVTDALTGVTLSLKEVMTASADFSVASDTSKAKSEIEDFIKQYNTVINYIRDKSTIDKDTGARGDFANDATFSTLRYAMRTDIVQAVTSQPTGAIKSITQLGIKIENDGTLVLSDAAKLEEAVKNDSGAVQTLFSGSDGLANRLKTRLDGFLGINGLIKSRETIMDARIKNLDGRIRDWDDRMTARENELRAQFAQLQAISSAVQGQQAYLNNFF